MSVDAGTAPSPRKDFAEVSANRKVASRRGGGESQRLIESFFDAQRRMDLDGVLGCVHRDVVMRTPYAPAPLPKEHCGKDAVGKTFSALFGGSIAVEISDVEVISTARPPLWLAYWTFEIHLKSGNTFAGSDIGTLSVRDGLIVEYTEYFDAIACASAYGLPVRRS